MSNYDSVEAGILTEGMTSNQKLCFHREMSEAWRDPKKAARLKTWLGGIGAHHFYLGDRDRGRKCRLFCWTGIPALMTMFEGDIKKRTEKVNSEIAMRIAMRIKGETGTVRTDSAPTSRVYAQLEKLADLKTKGVLSDEEFQAEKAKLLSGVQGSAMSTVTPSQTPVESSAVYQPSLDGPKSASGGSKTMKKILVYGGVVFGVGLVISLIGAVVGNKDRGGSTASAASPAAHQGTISASVATPDAPAAAKQQEAEVVSFDSVDALLRDEDRVSGKVVRLTARVVSVADDELEFERSDEAVNVRIVCQFSTGDQEKFQSVKESQNLTVLATVEGQTQLRASSAEQSGLYELKLSGCRIP